MRVSPTSTQTPPPPMGRLRVGLPLDKPNQGSCVVVYPRPRVSLPSVLLPSVTRRLVPPRSLGYTRLSRNLDSRGVGASSNAKAPAPTRLSEWLDELGQNYASEIKRHYRQFPRVSTMDDDRTRSLSIEVSFRQQAPLMEEIRRMRAVREQT